MDGRHFPPGKISLKMSLRSENVNSASSLRVKVENQSSKTPADKPSSGCHATAWFEHSSSDDKYEYAIYVKKHRRIQNLPAMFGNLRRLLPQEKYTRFWNRTTKRMWWNLRWPQNARIGLTPSMVMHYSGPSWSSQPKVQSRLSAKIASLWRKKIRSSFIWASAILISHFLRLSLWRKYKI